MRAEEYVIPGVPAEDPLRMRGFAAATGIVVIRKTIRTKKKVRIRNIFRMAVTII